MSYFWKEAASCAVRAGVGEQFVKRDFDRMTKSFYGPINQPLVSKPVCVIIGNGSGIEAHYLRSQLSDCHVIVLDCAISRFQFPEKVTYIKTVVELVRELEAGNYKEVTYCRIDENYFSESLIDALSSANIKINYLCGCLEAVRSTPYQLHKVLSKIADKFFICRQDGSLYVSKNETGERKYVSVIVPVYGVEKYIDQCLESLVAQSMDDIDIIVVNDGSKDRSGQIADRWQHNYPDKIRVIHKVNGGCASARNAGLEAAMGYYVGFVDGDDWVAPAMYEDLINAALPGFQDIVQCGYVEAFEDGSRIHRHGYSGSRQPTSYPYHCRNKDEYIRSSPAIWRRIYRRSFLTKHKLSFYENLARFDDLPFAYLALRLASAVCIIPESHYFYRLGRPGQDVSFNDERLFIHFEIFDRLYYEITNNYNIGTISDLLTTERASHDWAMSFIREDLKEEYRQKADASLKRHGGA